MSVKLDDWKNINKSSESERISTEQARERKEQQQFEKDLGHKSVVQQTFLKGMTHKAVGETGKAAEKPVITPDKTRVQGPDEAVQGKSDTKSETKAEQAENAFQDARTSSKTLNDNVLKTPRIVTSEPRAERPPEQAPRKSGPDYVQGHKSGVATKEAPKHAVADGREVEKRGKEAVVLEQKAAGKERPSDAKRDVKAGPETPTAAKGESIVKDAAVQASVAGGVQGAKAEGKEGRGKRVDDDGKGKKSSRAVGHRPAYAGTSEAEKATGKLATLLGGQGESPFDLERHEIAEAEPVLITYEPLDESKIGTVRYTNIPEYEDSEQVRGKARLHEIGVEKRLHEKVAYSKWHPIQMSIQERIEIGEFIAGTSHLVDLAQQIIRESRQPKDPRGFGTAC